MTPSPSVPTQMTSNTTNPAEAQILSTPSTSMGVTEQTAQTTMSPLPVDASSNNLPLPSNNDSPATDDRILPQPLPSTGTDDQLSGPKKRFQN
ncbi:hypothetical protein JTE90_018856 [Oedothorax gibbosus]|uniref:Uncharacterized protein n=1 Tax=Oedothorax gibbosus TaxID=931172 RepID=A0AAV6TVA0_9ARAC|nr:hypothetical protein JTE90_018856 [Oedothorax gibbosus]